MRHITVIHPSRGRAELCKSAAINCMRNANDWDNCTYLYSIEPDQERDYLIMPMETISIVSRNDSAISAINVAASYIINQGHGKWFDIILVMSDDFELPIGWDTMIREAVGDKTDFVLKTFDGIQKWIVTLPIMDKAFYERFNYVYYPGYKHMFCDTELTTVAEYLDRLIIRNDILFPHKTEVTGNDAINKKNNATWDQGEKLYLQRYKRDFDLPKELIKKRISHKPHQQWINSKIK
jgi:hypothetical protein